MRVGLKKIHWDQPLNDTIEGCKKGWMRPKIIIGFEGNLKKFGYYGLMDIMRLGFERNPGLWQIFEISNLETLAWSKWRCSSTCVKFDEALDGIVSIRPRYL